MNPQFYGLPHLPDVTINFLLIVWIHECRADVDFQLLNPSNRWMFFLWNNCPVVQCTLYDQRYMGTPVHILVCTSSEGNLNFTACNKPLDCSVLSTLGSSLGKAMFCFNTAHTCTKPWLKWFLVWKNFTGRPRALTSTPSNAFGMN